MTNTPLNPEALSDTARVALINSARELGQEHWCLSVPAQAKKVLNDCADALTAAQSHAVQLVTIKLPKNPDHNPREKLTNTCAVSPECTDSTGEHHTVAVYTDDEVDALRTRFGHITRIERVFLAAAQPVVNSFDPRELNRKGWTCGCEPGDYDECVECQSACNELANFLNRPEVKP